jgi:hypothetical protein
MGRAARILICCIVLASACKDDPNKVLAEFDRFIRAQYPKIGKCTLQTDMKKTDSVASPFVGVVTGKIDGESFPTKLDIRFTKREGGQWTCDPGTSKFTLEPVDFASESNEEQRKKLVKISEEHREKLSKIGDPCFWLAHCK